ncbi:MAG: hypothetical protein M1350_06150 [Actinobacteria bacterium]|nr:hypothetical protein [Actinomycetota bacterium]
MSQLNDSDRKLREGGKHLGTKALLAGSLGILGGAFHLDKRSDHGLCPLGLVPHNRHRGEISDEMSPAHSVACAGVVEVHGEPVVDRSALVAGEHA